MDSLAVNFRSIATVGGILCIAARIGCTDSNGNNFDASYNVDSGQCLIDGCTDSSQLGYAALFTGDLPPGYPGACVAARYGCTKMGAANFNSTANWEDGSCVYGIPPSAPITSPSPPPEDFLVLGLTTSYTLAELDNADLQVSVPAVVASVPSEAPDWSSFSRRQLGLEPGGRVLLDPVGSTGELTAALFGSVGAMLGGAGGRRLESRRLASVESLDGWTADTDWRKEYARRIARVYWLPRSAVSLKDAVESNGETLMSFSIAATALPAGTNAGNLKAYAQTLPASLYAEILAVPILAVGIMLQSEIDAGNLPPPPAPPVAPIISQVTGMAPGVIVAIVLPIVAVLLIGGVSAYWYRKRKLKRIPLATVQPEGPSAGQALLVRPPDIPE
jgi:hypothetical protein